MVVAAAVHQIGLGYRFYDDGSFYPISSREELGFIVAIGDNKARADIFLDQFGWPVTIIHPRASVPGLVGAGTFINDGAIVSISASVGDNVIVNTGAIVDHHCVVHDHAHVAPGAVLCGGVEVGEGALIGANATVLPGSKIPAWSIVKAGSLYGNPHEQPGHQQV